MKLDDMLSGKGRSAYHKILTNLVWGFNHRNTGIVGLDNDDTGGFIFITRPEFNLSYNNIKNIPEFDFLWNGGPYSMGAVIRAYLDPISSQPGGEAYTPLVDHRNPFIPMLTNLCLDFSGIPDVMAKLWTSDSGKFEEEYFVPNGVSGIRGLWDCNINFRNVKGSPITLLFFVWVTYVNRIAERSMDPRERNLVEDEMDSTCRIYRYVTDVTGQKFTKSACSVGSIPTGSTIGSDFDLQTNIAYSDANKTVSVPFSNTGCWYLSRDIHYSFNKTVYDMNPDMKPDKDGVINNMQRLTVSELGAFNWQAYPRIEEVTGRLDWYVPLEDYEAVVNNDNQPLGTKDVVQITLLEEAEARFAVISPGLSSAILES